MKKRMIKLTAAFLLLMMVSSIALAQNVSVARFSDVPETYWGYETIMKMTKVGLFKGTSEPVNGVGTFMPEKAMTRAEFIAASLRALYPTEAKTITNGTRKWWDGYYALALEKKIVRNIELDFGDLDQPMTREEMAMVMVRCVEKNGETLTQEVDKSQIADYSRIGDTYKGYVRTCFSFGLLGGVDKKGTFAPQKTLTRAEAATVLCRLLDKDMRLEVTFPEEETIRPGFGNNSNSGSSGNNTSSGQKPSTGGNSSNAETTKRYPWDKGGKKPSAYTWDEYMNLNEEDQLGFLEWFEDVDAFRAWQDRVLDDMNNTGNQTESYPWEEGGKRPSAYTWDEYMDLSEEEQEAFFAWFGSADAFEDWRDSAQNGSANESESYPWEEGGKRPSAYSWDEFMDLSEEEQEAFFEWFESADSFVEWLNTVRP